MEQFQKDSAKLKGIEALYFEDAEVEKVKGDDRSFASFGGLSVLYFKDLNRFILQLNDWRYPLLRRLSISSSPVKEDSGSRVYVLPAPNGFSYNLKINKVSNSQAFDNLEAIIDHNSRFSVFGKEIPYRKLEASPDDKALRKSSQNISPKEMISETVKKVIHTVQNKAATLKSGTKNLTSTKKKMDLNNLKTKDFRKEAKSRIKKGFFESSEKLSNEFLQKRKNNPNLSQAKEYEELKKISDSQAPSVYLFTEEIEKAILNNKSIVSYMNTSGSEKPEEKKGLMTSLREGARNIRDRVSNIANRQRNLATPEAGQTGTMNIPEGVAHYQG